MARFDLKNFGEKKSIPLDRIINSQSFPRHIFDSVPFCLPVCLFYDVYYFHEFFKSDICSKACKDFHASKVHPMLLCQPNLTNLHLYECIDRRIFSKIHFQM